MTSIIAPLSPPDTTGHQKSYLVRSLLHPSVGLRHGLRARGLVKVLYFGKSLNFDELPLANCSTGLAQPQRKLCRQIKWKNGTPSSDEVPEIRIFTNYMGGVSRPEQFWMNLLLSPMSNVQCNFQFVDSVLLGLVRWTVFWALSKYFFPIKMALSPSPRNIGLYFYALVSLLVRTSLPVCSEAKLSYT